MDKIFIKNLEIFANHGVFEAENTLGQKFVVSAALYTDTRQAGLTDDLARSINYGEVSQMITSYMVGCTVKLLETVAEGLAEHLLKEVSHLQKVDLEIHKPWAPVGLPLETVGVNISRSWHKVYIALGSNMGDRRKYLDDAVESLQRSAYCRVGRVSDFINTAPYGKTDQDDFLNGCMEVDTLLPPLELLELLQAIESGAKRERLEHWGPRTLDLDIIFYDDLVTEGEELILPHIEMHKRDFVLRPLMQIAPWKRHPISGKRVCEMLAELQ